MRTGRKLNLLLLALGAMFLQQTFASLGRSLPPVIAPAIIDDLRLDPTWLGVYVAIAAFASLLFQLGCGSFIVRYGALRTSQVALAMLAIGLVAAPYRFEALPGVGHYPSEKVPERVNALLLEHLARHPL